MKFQLASIIFLIICGISVNSAFGHGLGGETHPPVTLEGRDVTLSIDISPSTYDPEDPERYITVNLNESKSQAIVEHVTFTLELIKDGEQIFRRMFHDDLGNLTIKVVNDGSSGINIRGDKSPALEAWMRTDTEPVTMTGPIFDSGGLYEYKIEILTVDSDFKFLDKRLELVGGISLAEHKPYEVKDSDQNTHQVNVISYFDTISNFEYNSEKISFTMPFDWNQDFEQLTVVHQEVRISEAFSEFLHTKYDATVNGIQLKGNSVTIDDYSSEDRTIHIVLNKEELKQIRDQAKERSDSEMHFELGSGRDVVLPLEATTPDLRYQVYLSWEPKAIKANEEISFFIKTEELFTDNSKKKIDYNIKMSRDGDQIFQEAVSGFVNSETPDQFQFKFLPENIGTVQLEVLNIEGYPLANVNFLLVVEPQDIEKFPVRLESMSMSNPNNGKYEVDLTWFPNNLGLGESEFIMSFYERETRAVVRDVTYDFVLIQNGIEIHRKSGIASGGGTFENFVFVEKETGDITLRIEKINGTDEYVEIPINVAPEFPLGVWVIFAAVIIFVLIISKIKFAQNFQWDFKKGL